MKLFLSDARMDVAHESNEAVLVAGKWPEDNIIIFDLYLLEILEDPVGILRRSEDDWAVSTFQSNFFSELAFFSEIILNWGRYTFKTISSCSVSAGGLTTLIKSFLSVYSFWPKA